MPINRVLIFRGTGGVYNTNHPYHDEPALVRAGHVKVLGLSYKLSELAGKWRYNQDDDGLVHEYKSVLYEMILNGYDVNTLPIQDQLPEKLMPELPPKPVQMAIQSVYQTE